MIADCHSTARSRHTKWPGDARELANDEKNGAQLLFMAHYLPASVLRPENDGDWEAFHYCQIGLHFPQNLNRETAESEAN